jgi:hypothetical protein
VTTPAASVTLDRGNNRAMPSSIRAVDSTCRASAPGAEWRDIQEDNRS